VGTLERSRARQQRETARRIVCEVTVGEWGVAVVMAILTVMKMKKNKTKRQDDGD
jgi:hypothetical protein